MKRIGGLFDKVVSEKALYEGYLAARRAKRKTQACLRFSARIGAEIGALHAELVSGEYRPRPYRVFEVPSPKPRMIYAPDFRDVVVQHSIYAAIYPVLNRSFIDSSCACRIGLGTHAASDYALRALRASDPDSYVLHLDVRKFFYSIDRQILAAILRRKIKDRRLLRIMDLFMSSVGERGIPIGNLLSQLYALAYLNPVDHFIKRELRIKHYVRYVDDMVLIGLERGLALEAKDAIEAFLRDRLRLEYSKWSLVKVRRGVNFVGYRTWASHRLIRKYSWRKFRRAVASGKDEVAWSIIAHAQHTASMDAMGACIRQNDGMYQRLPEAHKRRLAA